MTSLIFDAWAWLFARASFVKLNRFLYMASLRGLGVLNFGSMLRSGETHFLQRLFAAYGSVIGGTHVVLDVGANVGNYASAILAVAPAARVFCFEPHPTNIAKLRHSVGKAATVVPRAVGAQVGSLDLFDYADEDGSSHASVYKDVFEKIHHRAHVSHRVEVTTVDSFLEHEEVGQIVLLKIDTEGHELAVLAGASRALAEGRIDVVHFEFNEMNIASRTFIGDFFQHLPGFDLYRLLPNGWISVRNRPLENVFAFQNIVAIRRGCRAHEMLC